VLSGIGGVHQACPPRADVCSITLLQGWQTRVPWWWPCWDREGNQVRIQSMNADGMQNRTYIVRFKPPEIMMETVAAVRVEIQGEHLIFLDHRGRLAALFLMELVRGAE
jgi:hypothetical protein